MSETGFTSAKKIARGTLDIILPPVRDDVADYAAKHRFLTNAGGGYVGRWRHEIFPPLVAPMRALTSRLYLTTAVVGPGQCGKTSVPENWLQESVEADPADMLWYMQTDPALEAYVKKRINPMIRAHEEMRSRLGDLPTDNSLHFKQFRGMAVEFLSANESNLINKSAPRIVGDEIDGYDVSIGGVKEQWDVRRQTFGRRSMLYVTSHCDRATGLDPERDWNDGIMSIFKDSTRCLWWWRCPHCKGTSSPAPIASRVMTLVFPEDVPLDVVEREARLKCPLCDGLIEDRARREMNLAAYREWGGWIGEGQTIDENGAVSGELVKRDTAGFWIMGVMSPFLLNGLGGLARAYAKAEREFKATGDDKALREVTVKQIGSPYAASKQVGSIDAETLAERARNEEQLRGQVPKGARFLTAWFDVQAAYFDVLVRGWGADEESWIVDKFRVLADTATDRGGWQLLLEELAAKRYPLEGEPSRGMAIRGIGYDSGGAAGVTNQAYAAWRALKERRLVRNFGRIDGRDVWSIAPTKGASGRNAPMLALVYPSSQRKDRHVVRTGIEPLALFNPNAFKDDLRGQLRQGEPGPSFVHFPKWLRAIDPDARVHPNFEQLVAESRNPAGQWERAHQGVRNEFLDMMVGTHVIARLHGLTRIKWAAPQFSWAREWSVNSMIAAIVPGPVQSTQPGQTMQTAAPGKPRTIFDLLG